MRQIHYTLYVMTPLSYLHLGNDTLRLNVERMKKLQVPLHHLGSVVCLGNIMVSPALMHRCADDGISLVLLDTHWRFKARLEGAVSGNILLRQAQHRQAGDAAFALKVSRAMIAGKLRNARQVLLRGAREAADEADAKTLTAGAMALRASVRNLPLADNLDSVRGIEGDAAKVYFSAMSGIVSASAQAKIETKARNTIGRMTLVAPAPRRGRVGFPHS
jgi:CRISPR-associated protein Cas1